MKTISKIWGLIIVIIMSLAISSCTKEDQYQQNVIGVWKISRIAIIYYENGKEAETVEEVNYYDYFNFDFKSDGTLRVYFDEEVGGSPYPITWKIENSKMILKESFPDREAIEYALDIVELTKSSMILSNTHNEYEMEGIHYKSVNKVSFTKK